jgi:hypothetical protein
MRLQAEETEGENGPFVRSGRLLNWHFTSWCVPTQMIGDQFDRSRKECNSSRYQQLRRDPAREEHWSGTTREVGRDVAKARTVRHTLRKLNRDICGELYGSKGRVPPT